MSKLLNQFEELKKQNKDCIYLFKIGIFYNIINEDAKIVSEALGLKITDLGPNIYKAGFPVSKIEKYLKLLADKGINFRIIDNGNKVLNNEVYIDNMEIKKIMNKIIDIDFNNTTFQQSFNILLEIQDKLKKILK